MLQFVKTTVLGGMVFLVPVVILAAVIGKGLQLTAKLADPLARVLPVDSIGDLAIVHLLTLAILVFICFLAGLVARRASVARLVGSLETNILDKIPAYASMKAKAGSVLTPEDTKDMQPTLIRFDDSWQLGFKVEQAGGGRSLVYLPGAPDPWSGSVCAVTDDRLVRLDISIKTASDLMKRMGKGSSAAIRDAIRDAKVVETG
jgi:uncharacterized membrane protein